MTLTLATANRIVEAALLHARTLGLAPMSVCVLDAGGHPVAFQREDRSGILRFEIAFGKAWGSLGMGLGSRALASRAETHPAFVGALGAASGGRVVPVPGGVLILSGQDVVGAVGVTGDVSDKDEACALAGILAAGLEGQAGAPAAS